MNGFDACQSHSVKTPWSDGLCSSALDEELSDDGHQQCRSVSARFEYSRTWSHRSAICSEGMRSKNGAANDGALATTETCATIFARMPSRSHPVSVPRRTRMAHRDVRCQVGWRSANQKEHQRRCCHVQSALHQELHSSTGAAMSEVL